MTEESENSCRSFREKKCRWPRGKCLGGSSAINANLYIRGNRRDFDQWAQLGNDGWDYNSVLKAYRILEDVQNDGFEGYGHGGYVPLSVYNSNEPIGEALKDSAKFLGVPTTHQETTFGYFEALQTVDKGIRANSAKIFLGNNKFENLQVSLGSTVEKVVFDGKKATGVIANIGGKKVTLKARKEIILSAGAVNTPQILLLSGIGPEKHLKQHEIEVIQDLKVGENLQDHIFFLGFLVKLHEKAQIITNVIDELYKYFMYNQGSVGQIGITNLLGFINSKNDSDYPNLQFHHVLYIKADNYLLPEVLRVTGLSPEVASLELEANQKSPLLKIAPTLLNPKSRGKILLKSKNPEDKPLIYANYFDDPQDVETILDGIKFALKQIESEPFRKFQPELVDYKLEECNFEYKSDDYWRCAIKHLTTTVYHPVGTCKMGPKSDPEAVVDSRLRVHGVENLRVVDASIMPLITSGNTNAPSLVIGWKGGEMIVEDWEEKKHEEL